ncbi:MAG: carboxyl transferase domain-containing protein [Thermomicrobiales bacterium]
MVNEPAPRDPQIADDAVSHAEPSSFHEALACPTCGTSLSDSETFETFGVCPSCHRHFPLPARERLRLLLDPGSFRETNAALVSLDPLVFHDLLPVPDRLVDAAERRTGGTGGVSEAVLTGIGAIGGHEVVVIALDHAYLGASIGPVAGEKILLAMETAAARRRPLIALCTAGGARTQEGLLGLIQGPKIAAAAAQLHRAGVPFVSLLAHPATGAAWAALATQADFIFAEPGARIGFGGRQAGETTQTAEALLAHGLVDSIVDRLDLRTRLTCLLGIFADRGEYRPITSENRLAATRQHVASNDSGEPIAARRRGTGWEEAHLARHPERPTAGDYLSRMVTEWVPLRGDRAGMDDPGMIAGLGRIAGIPVAIIAGARGQATGASAFRKAARLLRLAGHLELPVVALVDTPGLDSGPDSDPAQAAAAMAAVTGLSGLLPVPVVSVVIGEAAGAAGVTLGIGDRILMQEHAVYTVGGAEGADRRAAEPLAASRTLTAAESLRLGVIDAVIPEPQPAAHADPDAAARALGAAIAAALDELAGTGPRRLLDDRTAKLRSLGQTTAEGREAARREVGELQELQRTVARSLGDLRGMLEERGLPRGLQLPTLPARPRLSLPLEPPSLPTVERARSELVERAARLAARRRGADTGADLVSVPSDNSDGASS